MNGSEPEKIDLCWCNVYVSHLGVHTEEHGIEEVKGIIGLLTGLGYFFQ